MQSAVQITAMTPAQIEAGIKAEEDARARNRKIEASFQGGYKTETSVDFGMFNRILDAYRHEMTNYKITGSSGAKEKVDRLERWIAEYTKWAEDNVTANSRYIDKFVKDYSTTNPDLIAMQKKIQKIKTQGPELEDTYLTDKEAAETTPRDLQPYYIKGGIILGVAALVSVLTFF